MPLHARKSLGQHFLHDPSVIDRLVATIAPEASDCMVEIGGGKGALTFPLLKILQKLHVVEIDERMAGHIQENAPKPDKLTLHRSDALQFDFSTLTASPASLRVVGNLPYNISTPLLFHLLAHRAAIKDIHVMLQKEVAVRMTAQPGGKDYGRLTVMLALWAKIEHCFDIGPGAFSPPPKVRSTVVKITPQAEPRFEIDDIARYSELVALTFSMRRKTLARSLKGQLSRDQIASVGIDPRARPETLQPLEFARLADLGSGS
ncbi:MAG: 16S rRNA (adenine(1518)-N(6)/adenine(1519)-N(6))-dimethyltransferase RsmA [Candidatus Rariloculaceae bacterium]